MISITLPAPLLPLQNVTNRQHWAKRRSEQRDLMWRIVAALGARHRVPIDPATVTIERYGTHPPDHDGMVGGAKDAVDALRHLGLIVDDSPAHLEARYVFHKVHKRAEQRTRITIEGRGP